MLVIPAVDVLDGAVVRLRRGDFDAKTVYGPDPAAQVAAFGADGTRLVHVVDLNGAQTGRPSIEMWKAIATTGVPFQAGGGIRTAQAAAEVIAVGASRVVLGTTAVWEPSTLGEIIAAVGGEAVVAALDMRSGRALGAGWQDEGRLAADIYDEIAGAGVGTILVTSIVRDGTLDGPDFDLLDAASHHHPWRVIASGGVGSLDDIARLAAQGLWAVVVGRALYERKFTLSEAIEAAG